MTILQLLLYHPLIDIFHVLFLFMPNGILDLIKKRLCLNILIDNFHVLTLTLPNGVLDLIHKVIACFKFRPTSYFLHMQ
jgi:hypothetical protein